MANPEHLALLKQGVEAWNKWRQTNPGIEKPDLREADLKEAILFRADLREANLRGASLRGASLTWAKLSMANLEGADLEGAILFRADLEQANLEGANLHEANLRGANLLGANLHEANLRGADLRGVTLCETVFSNTHLAKAKGLDTCKHNAPSTLDFRTLQQSGPLPLAFLQGCGLPDLLIDYLPSLLNQPIQYYSCFISYSSKDEDFTQRLHADLQNKGVRCWFAPKDIRGGRKIYEQIGEQIRLHEKLLLVLSKNSINSEWVKTEIAEARQREKREKRQVLFPIRLVSFKAIQQWKCFDGDTGKDSAGEIREYFILDFSKWKSHGAYQHAFNRLLRDLKPELERKPETS